MPEAESAKRAGPGRPRAFDADVALDRAMRLFWRKGYRATSLTDLERAMGLNRASIYAAFGTKEQVFRRALERYYAGPASYNAKALEKVTAREVIAAFLYGMIDVACGTQNPPGCMLVHGLLSTGGSADKSVHRLLIAQQRKTEDLLVARLERAIEEGDLPRDTDAEALARTVSVVKAGIAIRAVTGATKVELRRVVDDLLRNLPPRVTRSTR